MMNEERLKEIIGTMVYELAESMSMNYVCHVLEDILELTNDELKELNMADDEEA